MSLAALPFAMTKCGNDDMKNFFIYAYHLDKLFYAFFQSWSPLRCFFNCIDLHQKKIHWCHKGIKPSHITGWLSVEANNKEYTKALHYWPFVMAIHMWPVDSPYKWSVYAFGIRDLPQQYKFSLRLKLHRGSNLANRSNFCQYLTKN